MRRGTPSSRWLWIPLAILTTIVFTGCHKPLFPENTPRTQFETYDRMRKRYTPLTELDVFGKERPALRARLSPETYR